jgi:penicillin-insensitive murein endopeptidase
LGVQTDAVELPKLGKGYVRYRAFGRHYWGMPRLVRAIEASAAEVEQKLPGGAPLVVGDLSARRGGKIVGHNSHRSGRDVDLLYYVTTPAGVPVESPGFVRLEADGLGVVPGSGEYILIDVPRQWLLTKALLASPEIGVQFMFVSRAVEALLIDYALARGEPLELVYRAQTVMLEPTDSLPHDDHLHLRIACAPGEFASGCSGGGPYWQWLPTPAVERELDADQLGAIAADDPFLLEAELADGRVAEPGGV